MVHTEPVNCPTYISSVGWGERLRGHYPCALESAKKNDMAIENRGVRVDQERYDAMVDSYRDTPGNFRACSRTTGVDRRTAKKAWEDGWPGRGLEPIKIVIEQEQDAARARLHDARKAELEALAKQNVQAQVETRAMAKIDAVESRTEEARMVRVARSNTISLMESVQDMLEGAKELAAAMKTEISITAGEVASKPGQAVALFQAIASTTKQANEAAKLSMAMERTLLGEPEKKIGLELSLSPNEAAREIELANRALARARARGMVDEDVLEGEILEVVESSD